MKFANLAIESEPTRQWKRSRPLQEWDCRGFFPGVILVVLVVLGHFG